MARKIIGSPHDDSNLNNINYNFEELYEDLGLATGTKKSLDDFLNGVGVISSKMLEYGVITSSKIGDKSVTNSKIGDLAIDGRTIYPNSISPSKIADNAIGSRHILDTVVSRNKLSSKFLFNRRIENSESIDKVFDDGTYIITAGNKGSYPKDADPAHNWVMSVEVINNVWVYQTLFRLEAPNLKYTRVILSSSETVYRWHKVMVGESAVQTDNLEDESVQREKLGKNFLYTKRIENTEKIDDVVNDGTYIITAGNQGTYPDGENHNLNWALKVEVVNTNWIYQTLYRLEQPNIRYTRVINNLNKLIYRWHKFNFGESNTDESGNPTPTEKRIHKKILMIGNSFSLNATQFLPEICAEQNIDLTVGILYRSGESLENHYNNAVSNEPVYTYYERTSSNGSTNTTTHTNFTFNQAVNRRDWEYVTFQQRSSDSNKYDTYQPYLNNLKDKVSSVINGEVEYGVLQTWALSTSVNTAQTTAYNDIVNAYRQAMKDSDLAFNLPAGTAIQNARAISDLKELDDELTDDGYHLSDAGKYIASATLFESLFRGYGSIEQMYFTPEGFKKYHRYLVSRIANLSVNYPESLTSL